MSETDLQLEKLRHEVKKLELEIKTLGRPFILQPTAWFTMIGLFISIAVNISQCSNSKNEATLAEIKVSQSKLDLQEIEKSKQLLKTEEEELRLKKDSLQKANDNLSIQMQINIVRLDSIKKNYDKFFSNQDLAPEQQKIAKGIDSLFLRIRKINENASKSLSQSNTAAKRQLNNNLELAEQREREGFQYLLDGDFGKSAVSFQAAENAYNGYHWTYELARFMRSNQNVTDPAKKNGVIAEVLKRYSRGAPPDLIEQLRKKIEPLP